MGRDEKHRSFSTPNNSRTAEVSPAPSCRHRLPLLQKIHQHPRRFRACSLSGGVQNTVSPSAEDTLLRGPAQGVHRPPAGLVRVGEAQPLNRCGRVPGVPPQHHRQLLPGDVVIGAEPAATIAPDDPLGLRPGHALGIPLAPVHVREHACEGLRGIAFQVAHG